MYLRNTWYVAGFVRRIDAGRLLSRTLLDTPLVFFRSADGAVEKDEWRVEQRPRQQSTSIDLVDETGHVPRIAQVHELSSGAQLRITLPASAKVRSARRIAPAPRVRPPALASPLPRSAVFPQKPSVRAETEFHGLFMIDRTTPHFLRGFNHGDVLAEYDIGRRARGATSNGAP